MVAGRQVKQRERERRGREGDSAQKSQITGLGETVGPRRVTGRNPGPQLSMSKWKGTGIKVWPCLKNAKCPLGGHHVCEEERTGQKRSRSTERKLGEPGGKIKFL